MELILDPLQSEAVASCCDVANRVVTVTGPAGTGKTTILKMAYWALTEAGYRVKLCSPTGKAAKRIYEVTGIDAQTIHRMLEYSHPGDPNPKTGKIEGFSSPRRHRQNPLDVDVVFCDEYAMVNQEVHTNVFAALPNGARICLFGDNNQLQPIEEDERLKGQPSPFMKLLANDKFKKVELKTVYRQGEDSGILLNANNLLKSRMPVRNEQWDMKITDQPVKDLMEYVMEMQDKSIDFSTSQHQIIVPQNTSWVGTRKLNTLLQGMFFNEERPSIQVPRPSWVVGSDGEKGGAIKMYVGDKVMYTRNNYDLGIFNGEQGSIIELDEEIGEIVVDFGDREQAIPPIQLVQNRYGSTSQIDPRKDLDLAYAVTTHKVQGSEYGHIVYIMNKSNSYMLNRRNFYTAITRAKHHVQIFADQRGLSLGVYKRN